MTPQKKKAEVPDWFNLEEYDEPEVRTCDNTCSHFDELNQCCWVATEKGLCTHMSEGDICLHGLKGDEC